MRNLLKRHPSTEPKPSLRARLTKTKAKAAGLGADADQGRRAVLAGSLAAAMPLPALAATLQAGDRETAFLALAPEITPLLRRLGPALAEMRRHAETAKAAAGDHPGWEDEAAGQAWVARLHAARDAAGYPGAWDAGNALCIALARRADPYLNEPMQTLPGIMLKAALNDLGDWWGESAQADVSRLAAEAFGLPAPAPFFQELAEAGVEPDDDA
ncbi:hypothetical protein AFCDBAGC_2774 [Methylobacterium cerastii]|uniref:Twin-arginine translocation pathway signal n=1 Tax=Methylobacterium cerastii TaxID=932741 RepID=A0ABQ4QJA7_9HYPH|nr:hypothetical protein [Methylobacterium cerastii]GJD44905.1 hypothetical protein AFCDBAGC_2774 [Methylobacterium cerastii]